MKWRIKEKKIEYVAVVNYVIESLGEGEVVKKIKVVKSGELKSYGIDFKKQLSDVMIGKKRIRDEDWINDLMSNNIKDTTITALTKKIVDLEIENENIKNLIENMKGYKNENIRLKKLFLQFLMTQKKSLRTKILIIAI